jgi:dihydrofolate reductase
MSRVSVDMSMSLDGFVAGPNTSAAHPLGEGGELLHRWLFAEPQDPRDRQVALDQRAAVAAVVLGRRTFDVGVPIWADVPYPVPCFVLTHRPKDELVMASGSFTFVTTGNDDAVRAASAAAGNGTVQVMGAETVQQVVAAGLLDEVQVNLVPVLLGRGVRMFDRLAADHVELERTRVIEGGSVTHLRFRVVTSNS